MFKKGRNIYAERKRIFMTDDSYIMKNSNGGNSSITKEDLNRVTCLKKEQLKLEKKAEEKEDYLMRLLKSELLKEKKIQKVQDKIKKKEEQLNQFLEFKKGTLKFIENERYQDIQDVHERQILYDKIMSNYSQKIDITKKNNSQNEEKMLELKEKIKDFETKNKKYKAKITEMFDLKESKYKDKKQNEDDKKEDKKDDKKEDKNDDKKNNKKADKKFDKSSPNLGIQKYLDMEKKFEIERFKRENVLMNHMNLYQKKIDGIITNKEKKEKKIQKAIEKLEKNRNEKVMMKNIHFDEVREKIKNKQKRYESERQKKIQNLEEKDLKDFAIKQEKIKLYEERKKMNQINKEEREALKSKFLEILKENKNRLSKLEDKDNEKFINNNLMYS